MRRLLLVSKSPRMSALGKERLKMHGQLADPFPLRSLLTRVEKNRNAGTFFLRVLLWGNVSNSYGVV